MAKRKHVNPKLQVVCSPELHAAINSFRVKLGGDVVSMSAAASILLRDRLKDLGYQEELPLGLNKK